MALDPGHWRNRQPSRGKDRPRTHRDDVTIGGDFGAVEPPPLRRLEPGQGTESAPRVRAVAEDGENTGLVPTIDLGRGRRWI